MSIETLPFERRPRNSIANNLDKINELIDWANQDSYLWASATGERVTVGDASSLKGLTVDGRSVQDGTPTPDAPVPVQVVEGRNLVDNIYSSTHNGVSYDYTAGGRVSINGTASSLSAIPVNELAVNNKIRLLPGTYALSITGNSPGVDVQAYSVTTSRNLLITNSNGVFTLSEEIDAVVRVRVIQDTTVDETVYIQLESGGQYTPYVPYGSISIVIGDTATPINLQGNTLASLPDGTRDELHVDSAGHVWIDKRVGRILTPTDVSNVNNLTQVTGGARWNIDVDGLTSEEIPTGSTNGYCSHTPFSRTLALGSLGSHVFTFGGKVYYVIEGDFTASTAVTWVNSHQMTIIYPLATPQTIDLGYIDPPAIPSGSVVTISASLTPEFTLEWWVDDGITALVDDLIAYVDYKTEG